MAKKRGKGGKVVAFPGRRRERWRSGSFEPTTSDGTPTFELDGEQCSEFGVEDPDRLAALCQKLINRKSWFMVIPPEAGQRSWMLLVQLADASFVMKYLDSFDGLYIHRGLQNPE